MQVHVAQQDADRSTLWCPLLVRLNLSIFQDACFQPSPDQADQARITDSTTNRSSHSWLKLPKKFVRSASNTHPTLLPATISLRVASAWWAPRPGRPPNERGRSLA